MNIAEIKLEEGLANGIHVIIRSV